VKKWWSILAGAALCCAIAWGLSAVMEREPYLAVDSTALIPETKYVALTFDDGPRAESTGRLLDGLAERGTKATFFLIGEQIEANAALVQRMAAEGHQVGNHTWSHVRLAESEDAVVTEQLAKTDMALRTLLGEDDYWVRVPYGLIQDDQRPLFSQPLIQWSVDPEDWRLRDANKVTDFVLENVQPGDIILLHDSLEPSVDAALRIVDALQQQGYTFLTVRELLEKAGVTPEAGIRYRSVKNALEGGGE